MKEIYQLNAFVQLVLPLFVQNSNEIVNITRRLIGYNVKNLQHSAINRRRPDVMSDVACDSLT